MNLIPEPVAKALRVVVAKHPSVTQVFYGADGRWMFCDEDFNAPAFGAEIDIAILEDAADAVPALPAAYSVYMLHEHED